MKNNDGIQLAFSRITNFTGRNGVMKCSGIRFDSFMGDKYEPGILTIAPITSKGFVGRCDITVPLADVPAIIEALQNLIK